MDGERNEEGRSKITNRSGVCVFFIYLFIYCFSCCCGILDVSEEWDVQVDVDRRERNAACLNWSTTLHRTREGSDVERAGCWNVMRIYIRGRWFASVLELVLLLEAGLGEGRERQRGSGGGCGDALMPPFCVGFCVLCARVEIQGDTGASWRHVRGEIVRVLLW